MSEIHSVAPRAKLFGSNPQFSRAKRDDADAPPNKFSIRIRIGEGEAAVEKTLFGRFAWTIAKLIDAGERGISSIDEIGPRLSHYIWVLRHREGIAIESIDERHGGRFPGRHSRYRLKTKLSLIRGFADVA